MSGNINSKTCLAIWLILLTLHATAIASGKIIYVPADFNNIQAAIDDANNGDTIIVADGIYTGDGNRDIEFKGKAITLRSERGPKNCIIDCNAREQEIQHRGFYFCSGEGPDSVLDGFIITNGWAVNGGGICFVNSSSPTIINCIIIKNSACPDGGFGGGIYCDGGSPTLTNCIISENTAEFGAGVSGGREAKASLTITNCLVNGNLGGYGGGLVRCDGEITNCTIVENSATTYVTGLSNAGGVLWCNAAISNCIIWGNTGPDGTSSQLSDDSSVPTYSCIQDWFGRGEGNIDVDPCFVEPGYWDQNGTPQDPNDDFWVDGDYHLKSQAGRWDANEGRWTKDDVTSLCIDAGNPSSPIGLEPFPSGGIINMGAYGGTAEASKSYFGEPICETIVAGDINGDCIVNFKDFALMAFHWLEDHQ